MKIISRLIPAGVMALVLSVASCTTEKKAEKEGEDTPEPVADSIMPQADSIVAEMTAPSPWSLVPVSLDGKSWSFVDTAGNILMRNEFASMPYLPHEGYFTMANDSGKYNVYALTDSGYNAVKNLEGLIAAGYMADGLIPVVTDGSRIEVYNGMGEKRFEAMPVDSVEVTSVNSGYTEGMLCFRLANGKMGFYDTEGNVAVAPLYDEVSFFSDGLAVAGIAQDSVHTDYTVIDKTGATRFMLPQGEHPSLLYNKGFNNGVLIATNDSIFFLYDTEGRKTAFPDSIAKIEEADAEFVIFRDVNNGWGVARHDGRVVIEPEYNFITFAGADGPFGGGDSSAGFFVCSENESFLFNHEGIPLKTFEVPEALPFGKFGVFLFDGKKFSLRDPYGVKKHDGKFEDLNMSALSPFDIIESLYVPSEESE